jgi:hypothetical protein
LLWPGDTRNQLVKETGFDVDNPMILAEMSFILSREPNPDAIKSITFAPEVIDLDQFFEDTPEGESVPEQIDRLPGKKLLFVLVLGIIVVSTGLFLFFRYRNS